MKVKLQVKKTQVKEEIKTVTIPAFTMLSLAGSLKDSAVEDYVYKFLSQKENVKKENVRLVDITKPINRFAYDIRYQIL